jgi:hypothetical protein
MKSFLNQIRYHTSQSMAEVFLEKCVVEMPIAMGPSRLEILSGLRVGSDTCGKSAVLTSLSLLEQSIGVTAGVSSSGFSANGGRTGTRLSESTHLFSLPVSLSSFGWGEWHLSGFFTERAAKSCPFLLCLFVLSPHVAGHFEILSNFFLTC